MKVRDLVRAVTLEGATLVRHGHDHDWYRSAATQCVASE